MAKSLVEQVKDVVIYAPIGMYKLVRNNASTVISVFANQGKANSSTPPPRSRVEPADEEVNTDSRVKKGVKKGLSDMTSDITKQRSLFNTLVGSVATIKDNAAALGGFSTTFEERGKKEVDQKVKTVSEKIPSRKTAVPMEEAPSPSVAGQCYAHAVDISTSVASGIIDVTKSGISFGLSTSNNILQKLRNTSQDEAPPDVPSA